MGRGLNAQEVTKHRRHETAMQAVRGRESSASGDSFAFQKHFPIIFVKLWLFNLSHCMINAVYLQLTLGQMLFNTQDTCLGVCL